MKQKQFLALACLILSAALLPSAFANHRTGSIIAPELLVAGDFNQDGNMDLAVNCTGFDVVAILFGDGQGGFTLGGHFPVHTLSKGLDVGDGGPDRLLVRDFNNDGRLDVFVNGRDDDKVVLYFGDGKGNFPGPDLEIEGVQQPYGMDAGDLNGDGKLDAAVCGVSNTPGQSVV